MFAADIRRQRVQAMLGVRHWRWHLDEMYVKLNGEMVYLWRGHCQSKCTGWRIPRQNVSNGACPAPKSHLARFDISIHRQRSSA